MSSVAAAPLVVIAAAGRGTRFAAASKQLVRVRGHSLLEWSLRAVVRPAACRRALVALPADAFELSEDDRPDEQFVGCPVSFCAGGASRAESVLCALHQLADERDENWVMVHDAVRPLLPARDVERLLQAVAAPSAAADGWQGSILAEPVVAALHRGSEEALTDSLERNGLWLAQTPQLFRLGVLRASLERAPDLAAVADEAQAVRAAGGQVRVVVGSSLNRKVTRLEDLDWVEPLLPMTANL